MGSRSSFVPMVITYRDTNIAQGGGTGVGQALVLNQSVEMNIAAVLQFIPLKGEFQCDSYVGVVELFCQQYSATYPRS